MCDFSAKLVAWADHELSEQEAAAVEQHLRECSCCRAQVQRIEQVSGELRAYCDALTASPAPRKQRRRQAVLAGGAIAAAVALAALFVPHAPRRIEQPLVNTAATSGVPAAPKANAPGPLFVQVQPTPLRNPMRKASSRRPAAARPAQSQPPRWESPQPVIEVAIPADAVLPPGAVPAGVVFIEDVPIGGDGWAQQMRALPQLVGFETGFEGRSAP